MGNKVNNLKLKVILREKLNWIFMENEVNSYFDFNFCK